MSEIRKHYFLSEYCIIAEERAKRPSDFAKAAEDSGKSSPASCSFCGVAEESTPMATAVYKNGKIFADTPEKRIRNWDFRCFPNLYPAFSPVLYPSGHQEVGLEAEPGYVFHEVVVESPLHGRRLENFSGLELSGLMRVYRDRSCNYIIREQYGTSPYLKTQGKPQELP